MCFHQNLCNQTVICWNVHILSHRFWLKRCHLAVHTIHINPTLLTGDRLELVFAKFISMVCNILPALSREGVQTFCNDFEQEPSALFFLFSHLGVADLGLFFFGSHSSFIGFFFLNILHVLTLLTIFALNFSNTSFGKFKYLTSDCEFF